MKNEAAVPLEIDRLVLEAERHTITAIGRTTAWRMERDGTFPRRVVIIGNRVGWRLSELLEFVRSRQPKTEQDVIGRASTRTATAAR